MKFKKRTLLLSVIAAILSPSLTLIIIFLVDHFIIDPVALIFIGVFSFFISYLLIEILYTRKIESISAKIYEQLPSRNKKFDDGTLEQIERSLEKLIQERKKEIDHLNKLETYRKEYIGNISHELKTPIFNIQGYIQTLLDGGLEDSDVNRKFLERADRSVERMITIVEDLQTITQFETGELELDFESFDISALANDVCDAMDMRAKSKNIQLTVREMDQISYLVYADRFRIRQVIANLIVNSIKYGKEGGETKIIFRDNGDLIMVEVSDNGIGIDKKHLPRLFERFYRVDKSRSREQGGSGLGLAIVKHIIEAHEQNINVMSTVGVGSVFSFNLEKAK